MAILIQRHQFHLRTLWFYRVLIREEKRLSAMFFSSGSKENKYSTVFHEAHTWLFRLFHRGDPGWRGGAVAGELRRQPGWWFWELQWVWWMQKGKHTILLIYFFVAFDLVFEKKSNSTSFIWCAGSRLCVCVLVLHSIPHSWVIMKRALKNSLFQRFQVPSVAGSYRKAELCSCL